jgi:hypothetical protein
VTEWWTYELSDFLMFSPQAYWRMVARHNEAAWPLQVLAQAAAFALPWLMSRRTAGAVRLALLVQALAWGWVAWAFHWQRYSDIFLAAPWVAAAFGVQAVLWLGTSSLGIAPGRGDGARGPGLVLLALAALYPLLAPLTGHPWTEAEVFGFMTEPTALAALGTALALGPHRSALRVLLAVIPLLALALGAATRWLLA